MSFIVRSFPRYGLFYFVSSFDHKYLVY